MLSAVCRYNSTDPNDKLPTDEMVGLYNRARAAKAPVPEPTSAPWDYRHHISVSGMNDQIHANYKNWCEPDHGCIGT